MASKGLGAFQWILHSRLSWIKKTSKTMGKNKFKKGKRAGRRGVDHNTLIAQCDRKIRKNGGKAGFWLLKSAAMRSLDKDDEADACLAKGLDIIIKKACDKKAQLEKESALPVLVKPVHENGPMAYLRYYHQLKIRMVGLSQVLILCLIQAEYTFDGAFGLVA
jgi:hypothetical protein